MKPLAAQQEPRPGDDRARAMAASVVSTARSLGMGLEESKLLNRAHALAMEERVATLRNPRHPLLLHPGHTVLVLFHDVRLVDPTLLAAAALTESADEVFRVPLDRVRTMVGDGVANIVEAVPLSGSSSLAEDLVTAPPEIRLVALAERLDHLRHAHLRNDSAWGRAAHEEASRVYLPVAERTHERLATRYRYWCRTFAGRFARSGGGSG